MVWPFKSSFVESPLDSSIISGQFPNRLYGCERKTDDLFTCLDRQIKVSSDTTTTTTTTTPTTTSKCSQQIKAYNDCCHNRIDDKKNARFRKVQERVPEEYRWETNNK
mmetsp:Transcript_6386/g.13260  ORF Transcript_6386/g.13260 Transcript_6386/m.13260 type:complete len:108 (+) Transcript_6386:223-546(+)